MIGSLSILRIAYSGTIHYWYVQRRVRWTGILRYDR